MNIENAFPSKYLKSGDIPDGQDLILTISRVVIETVGQGEDAEQKPIVYFSETTKGLILNKVNSNSIKGMYTPETDNWTGNRIALYATEVTYGAAPTLGIRVRLKAPAPNAPAAKVPAGINIAEAVQAWNDKQDKINFLTLCNAYGAQAEDVKRAFGEAGVMAWLKADTSRTANQAAQQLADSLSF